MAHRSVWIATNMSCTQPGRSGSALLSGAHLEQNAHRTAGKAPFRVYEVVYIGIEMGSDVVL